MTKKELEIIKKNIAFGFIESAKFTTLPMCLICKVTLSNKSMGLSKFKIHLNTVNKEDCDKNIEYFKSWKKDFYSRITIKSLLTKKDMSNKNSLFISYEITKTRKPHTVGGSSMQPVMLLILDNCKNLE